jgi:uncharacterized protein YdcH (DUF465 family)
VVNWQGRLPHREECAMMNPKLFAHLLGRKRKLDKEIENELKTKAPDHLRLLRLKKLRVHIKDRLYMISEGLRPYRRSTT